MPFSDFFPFLFFVSHLFFYLAGKKKHKHKKKPPDGEPTPQLRWTPLSTLLESAASDPVPRSATRGADTVRVRLSGIRRGGGGGAAAGKNSSPSPLASSRSPLSPLLEVSDASTRGSTCDALLHSSLEASALKIEGALARAVGGTLRMSGVVAWRPTGTRIREEEEEEEAEEGDENGGGGSGEERKKRVHSGFIRPFLLPTPAVLLVASDLPRASILAGRGDGAPARLAPVSSVASSSSSAPAAAAAPSSSDSPSSAVVAAGVVVSVGPLERDFGTAAAARAASGVARVVWLSDDFEKGGGGGGGAEAGPPSPLPPPTPLLLLDALSAAGDALCPGEVLLLPGATRVPPPAGSAGNNAPCALEARPGALLVVIPCSPSPSSSNDADVDDDEGLTTSTAAAAAAAAAAARPLRGGSRRPPFASLRPGVSRAATALRHRP